jgi:hypothetical protein
MGIFMFPQGVLAQPANTKVDKVHNTAPCRNERTLNPHSKFNDMHRKARPPGGLASLHKPAKNNHLRLLWSKSIDFMCTPLPLAPYLGFLPNVYKGMSTFMSADYGVHPL